LRIVDCGLRIVTVGPEPGPTLELNTSNPQSEIRNPQLETRSAGIA